MIDQCWKFHAHFGHTQWVCVSVRVSVEAKFVAKKYDCKSLIVVKLFRVARIIKSFSINQEEWADLWIPAISMSVCRAYNIIMYCVTKLWLRILWVSLKINDWPLWITILGWTKSTKTTIHLHTHTHPTINSFDKINSLFHCPTRHIYIFAKLIKSICYFCFDFHRLTP